MGGMGGGFGGMRGMGGMGGMPTSPGTQAPRRQAPPVEHILNLSLEDLYKGSSKRMRITKKVGFVSVKCPSASCRLVVVGRCCFDSCSVCVHGLVWACLIIFHGPGSPEGRCAPA